MSATNTTTETQSTNGAPLPAITSAAMVPVPPAQKSADLQAWELVQRKAKAFALSTIVPEAYRGERNMSNVIIAMEMADRIGASVMMVMQNLYIIHGNPGWSSKFLIATVNASGKFTPLRFKYEGKPGTKEWGCRAFAKDKGDGEPCLGPLVTIAMAEAEGWSTKAGSKWKTMPELMLMYRAAAFWTRVYAPELSLGMQTAEELSDVHGVTFEQVPAAIAPGDARALEAELLGATEPAAVPTPPTKEPRTKKSKPDAPPAAANADTMPAPEVAATADPIAPATPASGGGMSPEDIESARKLDREPGQEG